MLYRRHPFPKNRRYLHFNNNSMAEPTINLDVSGEVHEVPLPNVDSSDSRESGNLNRSHTPSFVEMLKKRVQVDDIILIGLIFILLDEGIDDEFLLILLIYILLT